MELTENLQIVCPIRGRLKVNKRSKDGLSATEEFYRVEAIKFLLSKGYPKENFWIEPIIKKFGNGMAVTALEVTLPYLMCPLQQLALMIPIKFLAIP